jgi:hypothetical protein
MPRPIQTRPCHLCTSRGVSYYIEIGEDSEGTPVLKCIRGTNAFGRAHPFLVA